MKEEGKKLNNSFEFETNNLFNTSNEDKNSVNKQEELSPKPINQLSNGLLGWYSVSSSDAVKEGKINIFTMYNEIQ